jgi:putative glycerol kinase 5
VCDVSKFSAQVATKKLSFSSAFKPFRQMSKLKKSFYVVLDLGTTSTRAHLIDKSFNIVCGDKFHSKFIQNEEGFAELDPELYFKNIVTILRNILKFSKVDANEIISLGICCQRATFITWDRVSGEPFHNLITWKDERGIETVNKLNKTVWLKVKVKFCKVYANCFIFKF